MTSIECDCGAVPDGRGISHRRDCALIVAALKKPKHATPSEKVTWKRIGMSPYCTACGRKLLLDEVRAFGTRYTDGRPERYVHCDCVRPTE